MTDLADTLDAYQIAYQWIADVTYSDGRRTVAVSPDGLAGVTEIHRAAVYKPSMALARGPNGHGGCVQKCIQT